MRDVKGKLDDQEAVRKALQGGELRLGARRRSSSTRNQYPIQNYYLRVVGKDGQGRPGQQDRSASRSSRTTATPTSKTAR